MRYEHVTLLNMGYNSTQFNKKRFHIDFISRGNILNNKVNLSYGPQTMTIATQEIIKSYLFFSYVLVVVVFMESFLCCC